jgi:hypothetical protein
MKTMTRLFFIAVAAASTLTAACAAPAGVTGLMTQRMSSVDQVRLVCDQDCRCWPTGYRARNDTRTFDERERGDPNACPGGGRYNGHYRSGPGTGLSFESRFPVRSFAFPF